MFKNEFNFMPKLACSLYFIIAIYIKFVIYLKIYIKKIIKPFKISFGDWMEKIINYFENKGAENTDKVIELVKQRKEELGIKTIVVASVSGKTALKLREAIKDANIVSITHHAGFKEKGKLEITPENIQKLKDNDVTFYVGSHALSGVGRGISNKFGGVTPVEIIAATLRMFGQGIKVCVEIAIMAADAGLIPVDEEIIAIGGTASGADAAVVLKAANMGSFFDLQIKEIIAMPRQ